MAPPTRVYFTCTLSRFSTILSVCFTAVISLVSDVLSSLLVFVCCVHSDGHALQSVSQQALPVTSFHRFRRIVIRESTRRLSRRFSSGPFHVVHSRSSFIRTGSRSALSSPNVLSRKNVRRMVADLNRQRVLRTLASSTDQRQWSIQARYPEVSLFRWFQRIMVNRG